MVEIPITWDFVLPIRQPLPTIISMDDIAPSSTPPINIDIFSSHIGISFRKYHHYVCQIKSPPLWTINLHPFMHRGPGVSYTSHAFYAYQSTNNRPILYLHGKSNFLSHFIILECNIQAFTNKISCKCNETLLPKWLTLIQLMTSVHYKLNTSFSQSLCEPH